MKQLSLILITALIAVFLYPQAISARSGCCSWHSGVCGCDSSVGRQVCCDGTYSPSCTCNYSPPRVYNTPTPTPTPLKMNINARYNYNEDACSYDVDVSWEKYWQHTKYSVSAVKTTSTECINPGPLADTNEASWKFKSLSSGDYKINIKPGNAYSWDNYIYCASLSIPKILPYIKVNKTEENGKTYIHYSSKCALSITSNPYLGILDKEGKVEIDPQKETTYVFTAKSREGGESLDQIIVSLPTPTVIPEIVINEERETKAIIESNNFIQKLFKLFFGYF